MTRRYRSGLTLVEVLVAGTVFAVVLGIVGAFLGVQSGAAARQKARNQALDAARIALELISWDIQNAGFGVPVADASASDGEYLGIRAEDGGARDSVTFRYYDRERDLAGLPPRQRVAYWIDGSPASLQRSQFDDVLGSLPAPNAPTVASIVGLNLVYETRANAFVAPDPTTGCPPDHDEVRNTSGELINCRVPWVVRSEAQRLVKEVRVQVLARSSDTVSGYADPRATYEFADGSSVATAPGYIYHFAEQVVLAPNLGR